MSRPENLRALADQLVWAIEEYVKAGIDDMKGDEWDADLDTLAELGEHITHETLIFPDSTDQVLVLGNIINQCVTATYNAEGLVTNVLKDNNIEV